MINVPKKDAGELQIERFGSHQFAPKSGKASEYEDKNKSDTPYHQDQDGQSHTGKILV